jgi:hypothetical protein
MLAGSAALPSLIKGWGLEEDEELAPGRLATTDFAIEKTGARADVVFDGTVLEGGYPDGENTEKAEA